MNLLILMEEEKYLPIVKSIESNELINCQVSNIDFNLDNAIRKSEVILFLGEGDGYNFLKSEYENLLATKLIITTTKTGNTPFEIESLIYDGVVVCRVMSGNEELRSVIIEVIGKVFDRTLGQLITDESTYELNIKSVNELLSDIQQIITNQELPTHIVQQLIESYKI
ncbi:hypothetical protein R2F61_09330 [Mollicutes bacterium LVI A0078]|nr:hypothetical protein RZE84_09105 [Mollicutes bacterium LVI A0075]WOO90899.1 hypothetical protein R2F61_09330 [Mollicutes bacterium LVI A0078]